MTIKTTTNQEIEIELLENYFQKLIGSFFKILPIKENELGTLSSYARSLQFEIIGCRDTILYLNNDASIMTLISIARFISDNPGMPMQDLRREVFKAISICKGIGGRIRKAVLSDECLG